MCQTDALDELQLPLHVLRLQAVAQEMQTPYDFANRAKSLFRIHSASVFIAGRVMAQKILILREDDSVVRSRKRDVFSVQSAIKPASVAVVTSMPRKRSP